MHHRSLRFLNYLFIAAILCQASIVSGQQKIADICRIKGQEENTIHGLGLVVGLKGTGDGKMRPTARSLARMMQQLGGQVSSDIRGNLLIEDVDDAANVAMVMVTATIPPGGARQGDKLNCQISAIHAKSLAGGVLMLTPMLGPRADRPQVFALAQGPINIPDPSFQTYGTVNMGLKMEADITNEFVHNRKLTLIIDSDHSSFSTAARIEEAINNFNSTGVQTNGNQGSYSNSLIAAKAIDSSQIEVTIPTQYLEAPVKFVDLLLEIELPLLRPANRVVISERDNVIVIGEDVYIAPVAISHNNISISSGAPIKSFVGFDANTGNQPNAKLKSLVDALNALDVPNQDVIAIIRSLKRRGAIYGEVIIN
jgi:flagellar P-ring protein precursor FlgI